MMKPHHDRIQALQPKGVDLQGLVDGRIHSPTDLRLLGAAAHRMLVALVDGAWHGRAWME
jgi:hypothetical protein